MFTKKKPEAYEVNDLARDLDAAIAKAQAAFVHSDRVVDLLENHIAAIRARQAAAYSSAPAFISGNL
jgi:hypothetical protein